MFFFLGFFASAQHQAAYAKRGDHQAATQFLMLLHNELLSINSDLYCCFG
jgi:hypothetical protein